MGKSLHIEKNKYGLRIYCSKCDRLFSYKTIKNCRHGSEKQSYTSLVYRIGGGVKKTRIEEREYDDALTKAINLKKEVKSGVHDRGFVQPREIKPEELSIIEAANAFLNFKHGIDVPTHLKQDLSIDYLKSIEYYVGQFLEVMKKNEVNIYTTPIGSLSDVHVGVWVDFIRERYSKGSWNAPLRVMRLWINFVRDRKKVGMYNPFKEDVKLVASENKVEAITKEEFNAVCSAVENANPIETLKGASNARKNRYRPYLIDVFKLALHTGLRREELLSLAFNDIHKVKETGEFMIITDNLKVERILDKEYKKKYIPVHKDLKTLLDELGWEENKGTDKYIIQPERTAKVKTMMSCCTKAFTHYFKQAYPEKEVKTLGVLRKTYLSYLAKEVGDDVIHFSSHSGTEVLDKHYFDKKLLAKGMSIKIFGR